MMVRCPNAHLVIADAVFINSDRFKRFHVTMNYFEEDSVVDAHVIDSVVSEQDAVELPDIRDVINGSAVVLITSSVGDAPSYVVIVLLSVIDSAVVPIEFVCF